MKDNIVELKNPVTVNDLLTEVLRNGARELLAKAVEMEVTEFLDRHREKQEQGKPRFVRNGYLPEREIQTGIGTVGVRAPRVRDRSFKKDGIYFGSSMIPQYL